MHALIRHLGIIKKGTYVSFSLCAVHYVDLQHSTVLETKQMCKLCNSRLERRSLGQNGTVEAAGVEGAIALLIWKG